MQRKLDRNPIGWLEQRTWSARLVTWSWLAIMISVLGLGVGEASGPSPMYNFQWMESFIAWLLAGSMAMSAAASFRRERESGVLELLLVSPLRVGEIVSGRLRGIWGQFAPAAVFLFIVWIYLETAFPYPSKIRLISILFFAGTFAILPIVGLYYSLRETNFISAFIRTLCVGLVLPVVLGRIAPQLGFWIMAPEVWQELFPEGFFNFVTFLLQIVCGTVIWSRLHRNLSQRRFAFQRGRSF
jgi:ABC-type transport system involved in cytochrome c biogenesis permease component